jgi:hypothetical protein
MVHTFRKEGFQMTTPIVSSRPILPRMTSKESKAPARRTYRIATSFVAVHFDQTGKGLIVFLPCRAILGALRSTPSRLLLHAPLLISRLSINSGWPCSERAGLTSGPLLSDMPIRTQARRDET